jgi:hypothetical protein
MLKAATMTERRAAIIAIVREPRQYRLFVPFRMAAHTRIAKQRVLPVRPPSWLVIRGMDHTWIGTATALVVSKLLDILIAIEGLDLWQ